MINFQRMVRLPMLQKHREMLLYLFFGGLTFLVSVSSYTLLEAAFRMDALSANAVSWVLAVCFAFAANRLWVFESQSRRAAGCLREIGSFFSSRLLTLALEELLIFVFVTLLHFPGLPVKIAAQTVVIVLNYLISKRWVFKG